MRDAQAERPCEKAARPPSAPIPEAWEGDLWRCLAGARSGGGRVRRASAAPEQDAGPSGLEDESPGIPKGAVPPWARAWGALPTTFAGVPVAAATSAGKGPVAGALPASPWEAMRGGVDVMPQERLALAHHEHVHPVESHGDVALGAVAGQPLGGQDLELLAGDGAFREALLRAIGGRDGDEHDGVLVLGDDVDAAGQALAAPVAAQDPVAPALDEPGRCLHCAVVKLLHG